MPADVDLNINIDKKGKGDEEAAVGLEALAKSADNAKDQLAQLDRKLLETRAAMVGAGKTFQETGDISPLKALLKDERQLSQVQKSISRGAEAIARTLEDSGNQGGQGFISRFTSKVESGLASIPPPEGLTQWLVLGAVAAAPAVGAALDAGVLLAVGGGAIALGIVGAVHDPRVRAAWSALAEDAKAGLQSQSAVFVEPLERAAQKFQSTLNSDVFPGLRSDFESLAPSLDRLSTGVSGFVHELDPGLNSAIQASAPVLNELADDLPRLGQGISFFLDQIGKGGPGAVSALQSLTLGLDSILASSAVAIRGLSLVFAFTNTAGGLFNLFSGNSDKATKSLFDLHAENDRMVASTQASSQAFWGEANAAYQVANSIQALSAKVDGYIGKELGSKQASLQSAQAFNDLRDSIKQNGKALDDHSVKGIRNEQVILSGVQAFERERQASIDAAGGQNASAAAVNAANAKYDQQVGALSTLAHQLGLSDSEVNALIGDMRSIPNIERTVTINQVVRTAHIDTSYQISAGGASPYQQSATFLGRAMGGVVAAARGMIASSPTVLFGERGTGLEAYIPKLGISDQRGLALADQAASWHGGMVVPKPAGYGGVSAGSAGGGPMTVKLVVTADGASGDSGQQGLVDFVHYAVRMGWLQLKADPNSGYQVRAA